jgi:transposase InsO family protein
MTLKLPRPTRAEEMAVFRHSIVGDLVASELDRGDLQRELKERARKRYRPPGAQASRTYHWKTLQDWFYRCRAEGLQALAQRSRSIGHALALDEGQRELMLDMRREHTTASTDLLLAEAVRNGVIPEGAVSEPTLRRLYRDHGLGRHAPNRAERRERRRWEADRVCRIWHADVCHVWLRDGDGRPKKAYVHGILDDRSRFVLALRACETEREVDLLSLLCEALLRFPACDVLYVDNGACYRGDVLALVLDKLGIRLLHAAPFDPRARGKMERLWRTLRSRALDHLRDDATLQDLNAALLAFLDADYHRRPHGGLLGDTPSRVFQAGITSLPAPKTPTELAHIMEVPVTRKVRGDSTFSIDAQLFEVGGRHLAGKTIEVVLDAFTGLPLRATHQGQPVRLGRCDPTANSRRGRPTPTEAVAPTTPFDPIAALLAAARKENPDV